MGFFKKLFGRKKSTDAAGNSKKAGKGKSSTPTGNAKASKAVVVTKPTQGRSLPQQPTRSDVGPAGRAPRLDASIPQSASYTPTHNTSRDSGSSREVDTTGTSPPYPKTERVLSPNSQGSSKFSNRVVDENLNHSNSMASSRSSSQLSHHQLQQFDKLNSRSPPNAMYSMSSDVPRGQMAAMDDMNRSDASSTSFNLSTDAEDSEYEHLRRRGVLPGHGANSSTLDTSIFSANSQPTYGDEDSRIFAALQTDDDMTLGTNPSLKEPSPKPSALLRPLPDPDAARIPTFSQPRASSPKIFPMRNETEDDFRAWTVSPTDSSPRETPGSMRSAASNNVFNFNNTTSNRHSLPHDMNKARSPMSPDAPVMSHSRTTAAQPREFVSVKKPQAPSFSRDQEFTSFPEFASFGSNTFNRPTSTTTPGTMERPGWQEEKKSPELATAALTSQHEIDRAFGRVPGTSPPGTKQYAHSSTGAQDTSLSELLAQAKNKQWRNGRGTRSSRASSSSVNSAPAISASYLRQHHNLGRYSTGGSSSNHGTSSYLDRDNRTPVEETSVSDIIQSLEATNQSRVKNGTSRSSYGHRSVGDTGAVSTARAVKERLREKRRKEREFANALHKSKSSEGSSSDNSENEASESWLFDEVTGALGPRGIAADLESLSGRSNRSKNSQGNKSHKSKSRRTRGSTGRRHKSSGDSVDSRGSRQSRYSHRSTKSFLSQMSEQSRSVANDLLRLEMQLAMVGSQDNRDEVGLITTGSVTGTSVGGSSRAGRSTRKSHSSSHRTSGAHSVTSASASPFTRRSKNTVLAPPGKLGIILANKADSKGTVVSGVRSSSVLVEKISPGDRIIAIDGEDVSRMTVSEITTIMSRKADYDRTLTVLTTPKHMDHQLVATASAKMATKMLSNLFVLVCMMIVGRVQGDVCLLVYQMADNNLEYFMRQDNYELTISDVVQMDSVTTWVYFDHRNYLGTAEDIYEPLVNVYNSDGSAVTGTKTQKSQYMYWDHGLGKMVIYGTSSTELDGDSAQTLYDFVTFGLQDCVTQGSDEFVLLLSSHGGGFYGFGGDDSTRDRRLTQSNANIVYALTQALAAVSNAPSKFDVIGFDACLMQAVGSADEYRDVADYLLASEAVEPGHGWAYDVLTEGGSALGLAKDIQVNFLSSKQGYEVHLTPKTLSVIDLSKYTTFLQSWNALAAELNSLLVAEDPQVFIQLNRARQTSIAFEGVFDEAGTSRPSSLDIGHFLQVFTASCVPGESSALSSLLTTALEDYDAMFEVRGNGLGTVDGTGMHITWPVRKEYFAYKSTYDLVLFDTTLPYATADAPSWLDFLATYYETTTPSSSGSSVCTVSSGTVVEDVDDDKFLINPTLSAIQDGGHYFETEVTSNIDEVFIEYGIDLTPLLSRRRVLQVLEDKPRISAINVTHSESKGTSRRLGRSPRTRELAAAAHERRLNDYFIVFGGSLLGNFSGSTYSAFWDRHFYLFQDSDGYYFNFYAFDNGGGSKSVPVVYMPPENPITSDTVANSPLGLDEDEFISIYGGQVGTLVLSTTQTASDGTIKEGIALFTSDGNTLSETPRSAGGQILPIQYVEGSVSGTSVYVIVGGVFSMVLDWDDSLEVTVATADSYLDYVGASYLLMDVLAYDDDALLTGGTSSYDIVTFWIDDDGSSTLTTYDDDELVEDGAASMSALFLALTTLLAIVLVL
eukprot:Nitzschia sp. Nitz4//scaffold15_size197535//39930//45803//NITZ4_001562-RA/size197535-processed-gene-0.9-mRNA-1//1//CDS//3329537667//4526//frame0